MSIYKSQVGKTVSLKLYDEQMIKVGSPFKDIYVDTSFGKTHLIESGNLNGKALLVFHGGNSTTAYNLLMCKFLLNDFHVYAVDIIGHPGKSDEVKLSSNNYDYGKWADEVITKLGFSKIKCFGGSFGGGVLAKLMCVAPEKVDRAVLIVPAGINNAFPISSAKMMLPLIKYCMTKKEKYLIETALFMAIKEDVLDADTLAIIKDSFDNVKTKVGMPSNVSKKLMLKCKAATLVMASEMDCLFPARKVLSRAKKIIINCKVHKLEGCGHMHIMPERERKMIIDFLNS
ncbi:alpha/beta hydrolase [Sedimentibacter sp. zth1]|nr:alpha/beta hydrolase [Sedimentibacter sp. zth1]